MKLYQVYDRLYVSGFPRTTTRSLDALKDVTAIVCVSRRQTPEEARGLRYWRHIHVQDTHREFPIERFREVVRELLSLHEKGYAVLVHCMEGRNRSMTAALLTRRVLTGESGEELLQFARQLRPNCLYNPVFTEFIRSLPRR